MQLLKESWSFNSMVPKTWTHESEKYESASFLGECSKIKENGYFYKIKEAA